MKKVLGTILSISLLIGGISTPVWAATTSATLNSSKDTVTTYYSDCKSSTIAYVYGYEVHPTTNDVVYYNKQKTTSSTGGVSFIHKADAGYEFQLTYNGTQLKSKVVVGGSVAADVAVTY